MGTFVSEAHKATHQGCVFGPAGIPLSCQGNNIDGLKHSLKLGLKAYEVEFVHGVRMTPLMAKEMRQVSNEAVISCHAPYYLNCNNPTKYKVTEKHLMDCIKVSQDLKLNRIVFHVGYLMGMKRDEALKNSINSIKKIIETAYSKGLKDFTLGPEIAGKQSQVGNLDEIITLCKEIKECKPVIDWAHQHAVTNGGLKTAKDFQEVITKLETELGKKYLKGLHCHFSNIEYGLKGEIRHHPLGSKWGPDFKHLAKVIKEGNHEFVIISETPLIEEDALKMQETLNKLA